MSDWKANPDVSAGVLFEAASRQLYEMGSYPDWFYAKEKKMKRNGRIRTVFGVIFIVAAVAAFILLDRNNWVDCLIPSIPFGIGLALCKSNPYTSFKTQKIYVDKEDVAKGFFIGFPGIFIVLVVFCYAGKFFESFFGA